MRRQISTERWEQIKTAFASGIRLRELARNMGVSKNTVFALHALRQLTINDQS
jgi:DNA-binding CsgD family transcriptional regulator